MKIAVDAMGGDRAPEMVIQGARMASQHLPGVEIILVGQREVVAEHLRTAGLSPELYPIAHASEVVAMDEKPSVALRTKRDSSLRVGANLVKSGAADAFVSAGNTGALMATAKFVLKTLPGIERPAIASMLPSATGQTLMLDLGANVDCNSSHLVQFALMGEVFARNVLHLEHPRLGLLNIGEEEVKGNEVVRETGERLRGTFASYIGNVEGTDIFSGKVDVVICDGFVGNVSLKTTEGVAQMLTAFLKEAFSHSWIAKIGYLMAKPALNHFRQRVDHRRYNGAILLGLNGIVVKSHGSADGYAFFHAIKVAEELVRNQVNEKISAEVISRAAVPR